MKHKIREIVHQKLAKLLDHLYFQESRSSINVMIVLIFFIQKINLMFLNIKSERLKQQELYFYVCQQVLAWVTFQKPLEILDSDNLNILITIFYTTLQLTMFFVFCFSLYKWQIISKLFSFYISNFQLLILYHTQIHILAQKYWFTINILISVPLYINYMIIVYCSRNYFIMSQTILRRYSVYNFFIILFDYTNFILFNVVSTNIRQYLILILFIVYFCDSFFLKPYSTKINKIYVLATSTLVVSSLVKISMINFQICDQIYFVLMLAPLISILAAQFLQISQQNTLHSTLSLELIIYLGEFTVNSSQNKIEKSIGGRLLKKLSQEQQCNSLSLLNLLQNYSDSLLSKEIIQLWGKQALLQQKEEIQLYIIFLSHNIKGSYLQCLLQAKKFQLHNQNHSLFFQVISNLLSQKYDKQVENFGKTETTQILNNHKKLVSTREFQLFYSNNIDEISDILDEKIKIWNKILQGFNHIDDALELVFQLNKKINTLKNKHSFNRNYNNQTNLINFKDENVLTMRYFSFFYSYIENDFLSSMVMEKQIEQLMNLDRDKILSQTINMAILKGEILIISASVLENKGGIINSETKDLNIFFNLESQTERITYINQLMPNFIKDKHNNYIDEFISKGVSDLYNKSKLVFGLDGQGFVLPLELSFLHINERSRDFILTAILKKSLSNNNQLILFQENGKIIGISKKVYSLITNTLVSQQQTQQIDVKIYDCFIQFWIPQVMQFIYEKNNEQGQKVNKQVLDVFLLGDLPQEIGLIENFSQENLLTSEQISQSIQQFYLNQSDKISPQKIQLEAEFIQCHLPNDQIFYCLQFPSLNNEIFSTQGQDNYISLKSPQYQQVESYKKIQNITEVNLQTKRITENQFNLHKEHNQQLKLENLESHFINFTQQYQDHLKEADMSFQTKRNLVNYQALSQSSKQSNNSNLQIYQFIKQITETKDLNNYVKRIFIITLILQVLLILISATMLKIFQIQNNFLQENVQLARYPDKFNRLYCSFATMGQLDLERSLLGAESGDYAFYRIKELSQNLREQMEGMMPNLRIQFSNLEEQNRLPELTIRIINYFSYSEEKMRMIQFNFLAEATTDSLNQKILSSLEFIGDGKNQILDQYFQLQFLKGNLISQISSSQRLIDEIIVQINDSNSTFYSTVLILLLVELLLIFFHATFEIYLWRKSYESMRLMIQLITFSSDQFIYKSIDRAQQGKQHIKSHGWKQINFFNANFSSPQSKQSTDQETNLIPLKNKNKLAKSLRINHEQFQFKVVYLKIFLLMLLITGVVLVNYIYLVEQSKSSEPEMDLTLEYVQFKQDWDSLMILSYLLKTNSVLTQRVKELGFLDKNQQLENQNLYFHDVYSEFLKSFSETVPQAQSFNVQIFSDIVNSNRILPADKQKLYNLYENDLCIVLLEELPFCSFKDGKFTYFPLYPTPLVQNNNREIFKGGINGLFQKILQIFQSQYELELHNIKDTNQTETKYYIQTQEFNLYILQYFFDINKAVVEFYSTILESFVNILQQDYQNILLFSILIITFFFSIYTLILMYFLWNLELLTRASKSSLTLLPQECLAESKCLMIIKKFKSENR